MLPVELEVHLGRGRFDADHPRFASSASGLRERLDPNEVADLFETVEVRRFWKTVLNSDGQVVARLADEDQPLLAERRIGEGLVVVMTTAIDAKPFRQRWNNLLSVPEAPWLRLVFLDRLMRYLSRSRDRRFNFISTETPRIALPAAAIEQPLKLQTPDLRSTPIAQTSDDGVLRLQEAAAPGHYRVTAGGQTIVAFSVQPDPDESDLDRSDQADLDTILGAGGYELARDLAELNDEIDLAEYGQEGFPFLLLLATAFFALETYAAARFYRD